MQPLIIQPWLDRAPKFKLDVVPAALNFESVVIGHSSASQTVSITNSGYADLQVGKLVSHVDYIFSPIGDSTVLHSGETLKIDVIYRPSSSEPGPEAKLILTFGCGVPLTVTVFLVVTT